MRLIIALLFTLSQIIGSNLVSAQEVVISGTVSDANGPLIGVNIVEKGTINGAQTDFNGNFSLKVSDENTTLVFSYVGYATKEVIVKGQTTLEINLEVTTANLDEVIVIAYGTTTLKDATGSLSAVASKDFNRGVIISPEQLIQGKAAGVQITVSSGEPGAGIETRIRGSNSVRSNNNPLFVVDGVPLDGGTTASLDSDRPPRNPLNFLNPSDIESISILKDASSTAIYGSRGANGVVIITTKSGKTGGPGVLEFSSSVSISSVARKFDLLNREEFLAGITQFGGDSVALDFGDNTDWQDFVTRTSISQNQNLSWSKNYGKGNIIATFGYGKENGIIKKTSLERVTGRLNWSHRFFDDKLELSFRGTLSKVNDEAFSPVQALSLGYTGNPTIPTSLDFISAGILTPSEVLEYQQITGSTNRFLGNFSVDYAFTSELSGKITVGYDNSESTTISVNSRDNLDAFGAPDRGTGDLGDINVTNNLLEAIVTYKKKFKNSSLDALVGFSYQDFQRSGRNVQGWGFSTSDLNEAGKDLENSANAIEAAISGNYQQYGIGTNAPDIFVNRLFPIGTDMISPVATNVTSIFGDTFDFTDELQSFFARLNYSIANKYLFTVTARADGSSRFGPDNQYGFFPSAAIAWKIDEEDFIGSGVSTLKLRASGGLTGNQEGLGFGNFVRTERYEEGNIGNGGEINIPGTQVISFVNNGLKWEETSSIGVGIDFGFNDDRLSGSIDLYRMETKDLLIQVSAAQPSPRPFLFQNLDAIVLNQGIEFALAYDFVESENFNMDASFNIAYNENELQDFPGLIPAGAINGQGLSGAFVQLLAGDRPLFSYYLRPFEGFDENGQPIGDGQTFVGQDALPNVTAGFSLNASYKNWNFAAYLSGQFDFSVYNGTRNAFFTAGSLRSGNNVTKDVLTSGESGNAAAEVSVRFLEKGDYVRMQNATIGYNVPIGDIGTFKSLLLSVTGQNLFLITGYSGLDPEVNTSGSNFLNGIPTAGVDNLAYPRPRTITFGLTAKF
ncbi:MAG: SusC/RagA family TonB-linked outer membrane protein [Eudoraea sp.]|uniref:SusC/RagA family TonB-linked outer membrane protein n=1 Tax=Eudoraea sp. TaxID=1979955 RepID=UPI003C78F362